MECKTLYEFNFKKGRRDFSRIALILVSVFLISEGGFYLLYYLADYRIANLFGGILSEADAQILLSSAVMYLFAVPIALLLFRLLPSVRPEEGTLGKQFFSWLLICFPIMTAGAQIGNLLSALLSGGNANNPVETVTDMSLWLEILCVTVLAPIFEELLFRRAIIDHCIKYGERPAILFSAVAFALFHGNLFQVFYAFGIGLVFGYVYIRTGKLRYSILLHAIINFWGSVVTKFVITDPDSLFAAAGEASWLGILRIVITLNYLLIQYAALAAGIVFLVKKLRCKLYFQSVPSIVPTGKVIRISFVNVGMILFTLLCLVEFSLSLFM